MTEKMVCGYMVEESVITIYKPLTARSALVDEACMKKVARGLTIWPRTRDGVVR